MELKVGEKCKQIKAIEKYGFDYVGKEFEITEVNEYVVMGKGNGVGFGIERNKFYDYFELVEEHKDAPKFGISNEADVTLKNKDTNEIIFKGKVAIPIVNHDVEARTYEKGDVLKITKGKLKDIEGTFINYVNNYDKVMIQIDELNCIYVDSTNIMLSKKKVNNIHKDEKYNDIVYDLDGFSHPVQVRFHKNHTYITLLNDGTKSRSSCYPSDSFNEEDGIKRSFLRAMVKKYTKELEKLDKEN